MTMTHSNHLTEDQIERMRRRIMSPEELIEVDEHLEGCKQCLQQVVPRRDFVCGE